MTRALITSAAGQDGAYLADSLLAKGLDLHGVKRQSSASDTDLIGHLYRDVLAEVHSWLREAKGLGAI